MSSPMLSIDTFAEQRHVTTRTVRRWLDAERIPGAVKLGGKWSLPADAVVSEPAPGAVVATRSESGHVPDMSGVTVSSVLAPLPVMVPIDVAARVLGLTEYAVRGAAEYFQLQRLGAHGSYVMPKARIRELEGQA